MLVMICFGFALTQRVLRELLSPDRPKRPSTAVLTACPSALL